MDSESPAAAPTLRWFCAWTIPSGSEDMGWWESCPMNCWTKLIVTLALGAAPLLASGATVQRQIEKLGRGVVAIRLADGVAGVGARRGAP